MLNIKDLHKHYRSKKGEDYHALKGLTIDFPSQGFVCIIGKSGSGKSTLLNVLGGLDRYDSGEILIKGKSSKSFSAKEWDSYRNTYLGFIFQDFNIIEGYSIGTNIALALKLQGVKPREAKQRTKEILESVEALELIDRKPNELSGGQKQRVAIARALVKNPEIIIADEPTGNLDSETSAVIMNILQRLAKERLVIMVTHDLDHAQEYGDRVIEMRDGSIIKDSTVGQQPLMDDTLQIQKSDRHRTETAIKIPKGATLPQKVVNTINELIQKHPDLNVYLTASTTSELAGIVSNKFNEKEHSASQSPKNSLNYNPQGTFQLIQSKLPLKNSVSMALNSIWSKKFKLLFTAILFIASIGLFGFSRTITRFDFPMAASLSYFESNTDQVFISRQVSVTQPWGDESQFNSLFTRQEVEELELGTQLSLGRAYDFSSPLRLNSNPGNNLVHAREIKGVLEIGSLASMNISLVAGSFPTQTNEVLITDYLAAQLMSTSYAEYLETEPMLEIPFKTVNVVGIVETNFTDYEFLNSLNAAQRTNEQAAVLSFNNNDANLYSRLIVGTGFFDAYSEEVEAILDYYGLGVFVESRQDENDFPYDWFSESFIASNHPIMETEYVQFFEGYSNLPDNGIIVDFNAYTRLLQSLNLISDREQPDYLFNQELSVSEVVDLLAEDNYGALTITTAFSERSSNRWYEPSDMVVVGVMNYFQYQQDYVIPGIAIEVLTENNIDFITEPVFFRYSGGAHQAYLDNLASIHLTDFPTLAEFLADGGNDSFEYYNDLSLALEEREVVFLRDNFLYGYSLYLTDLFKAQTIDFLTYDEYVTEHNLDPFAYIQSLAILAEESDLEFLDQNEFINKYLSYGSHYYSYLIQQLQSNELSVETMFDNIFSLTMLSKPMFDDKNPFSNERVHGLVVQLSDDIDENYAFFTEVESLGVSHLTPSGNLLQTFASFTSEADAVFGYISLGFASFAALLLFLNISASILAKKKDIGTLRALGARGNDVASIFVNEALLLGFISANLAVVGIVIATVQLNGFLSNQLGQALAIFNISPIIMAEMLLLTTIIVLTASFLPVKRVSSMKPIDAIKNK